MYAPDADLVFAEYFDACVWGGNYVGNTKGYTPSQTEAQQSSGSLSGTTAAGSATGVEEAPFYSDGKRGRHGGLHQFMEHRTAVGRQ